ncbi:hypothetical protein KIW84_074059 [Lathyrus oleraceus]|uniref:Uncharacterized protein n=1 Tax=Pisum sativum TaxID=3888 RepID=A0A9D4ZZF9_PEA|nr:hypothetical protein KIW84_074059 [Pisum sativum]
MIVSVFKTPERVVIQFDSSNSNIINRSVSSLVIRLAGPFPYASDRAVPYQYNATMVENGQEVPLPTTNSVVNISDIAKVTHSSRVFGPVFPKDVKDIGKKVEVPVENLVSAPKCQYGEYINLKPNDDDDVLCLIKKSEFNVVEQMLQTPSKISMISLLMNSEAHREVLQKVLEQAYVEHDVTVDQFNHILANITSCNNLSFCDEELPGEGAPMRYSGVIVKAFDGSRKTVISEVDLPVKIGPSDFQITFQNGKLVIMGGEKALLVSHLSSFSYVEVEDEIRTPFQALSIAEEKKVGAPMSSFKDAQKIVEFGSSDQCGRMVEVAENKNHAGLGFQQGSSVIKVEDVQPSFRSGGFIHGNEQHSTAVIEDDEDKDCTNFVTRGKACNNWIAVDVPVIIHRSKLVSKPIEYNDPSPSPDFDFPMFKAEEENDEEMYDELSRLLEHKEKSIQPFEEHIELVNLGSKDEVKKVKIGSQLCP